VKALDSSVLLALLEGEAGAREIQRRLRGVEVATTEANLLELAYIAAQGPERHRGARKEALTRLRRKITILPIDGRASETAAHHIGKGAEAAPPLVSAMMGALEASGCDELLTLEPPASIGKWRVRVTRISLHHPK